MRFVSAIAILSIALLASCSSSSEKSAFAKQLVGHWSTPGNDNLYFGEVDASSKIGSYILVHPDGKAFTHSYKVESVHPGDRSLKITLLHTGGDRREEAFVISKDGKSIDSTTVITGIEIQSQLTKVDDTTAP